MIDKETAQKLRKYAEEIILAHATDIEWLSIHEMAEEHFGRNLTDEEAHVVDKLICNADIEVIFTDRENY